MGRAGRRSDAYLHLLCLNHLAYAQFPNGHRPRKVFESGGNTSLYNCMGSETEAPAGPAACIASDAGTTG